MKKSFFLSLFLFCVFALSAQENIFVLKDSYISPKKQFIDSLAVADMSVAKPFVPVATVKTSTYKGSNTAYQVKLSKFSGDYPGAFNVLEVFQAGKRLCSVADADGWAELPSNIPSDNNYFFSVHLSAYATALFFFSQPVDNNPPFLTIVVIKTGKAHLVYHRPCVLQSISKNSYSVKVEFDDRYSANIAPSKPVEKVEMPQPETVAPEQSAQEPQPKKKSKRKKSKKQADSVQPDTLSVDVPAAIAAPAPQPAVEEPVVPVLSLIWSEDGLLKIKKL